MQLQPILEEAVFADTIMDSITSHLDTKGYTHSSSCPSEIIIEGCTKESGYQLVMDATGEPRDHIRHGFQMVANKNNLYIRKKYKARG